MINRSKIYSNSDIAEILQNIATAYEIKGKDYFRIKSYQDAAETIISYPKSIQKLYQKDPSLVDNIPGIGPNIFKKISYLLEKNKFVREAYFKEDFLQDGKFSDTAIYSLLKSNWKK